MSIVASHCNATTPADAGLSEPSCAWPLKRDVIGVGISATTYDEAVRPILRAARRREAAAVSCHAVHAVVTSSRDAALRRAVNEFEIVTPDGQPVRWALNLLHRSGLRERVYGPELMLRLCRAAAEEGVSIYLYGGDGETIAALRSNLCRQFPGLQVAGAEAPPFRELTAEEDAAVVERINASGAGLLFIGLGCPKQDWFAAHHRGRIAAVQVCVGAAFDFHAGRKPMAPAWMQRRGLEWLFRLSQEPRRLWRRYLDTNSRFVWGVAFQYLRRR
jgi:exopolysaccharide biosynthesis WecB/TagA/CpsF family protein